MKYLFFSIPLFRLWGVPVRMHTTVLLFPISVILIAGWLDGRLPCLLAYLGILIIMYASILVHEYAHVVTAWQFGIPTRRITLLPIGCIAELEDIPREPYEILVALAGPLASLALSGLFWLGDQALGLIPNLAIREFKSLVSALCLFNFFTGLFNLLPCFPMDGGRILRSLLAITIGLLFPRQAHRAFLIATRIAVRYIARPLVLVMVVATFFHTHLWSHLLVVGFVVLAGEAELFCLQNFPEFSRAPAELTFQPSFGLAASPAPRGSLPKRMRTVELVISPPRPALVTAA